MAEETSQFISELQNLLLRYNACISFACHDSSDLEGVYDPKIVVSLSNNSDVTLSDGYFLEASDLS